MSLAGPLAELLGAAVCALLWHRTGYGLWAALARSSAGLNVLNLIPVWVLDGGQAIVALDAVIHLIPGSGLWARYGLVACPRVRAIL